MALPDRFPWYSLIFFCLLGACGDDAPPTEDGGMLCATDEECDDGVYCNGAERCMPGDPASDGSGCVPSEPPCPTGMTCDEAAMSCEGECTTPDADEDGYDDVLCGGNDCDDADPNRFPGNTEVCDVDDHDEDCDPETYGFRDADEDGVADARCCNTVDGSTTCGTDCDDMAPGVNPTATESCDTLDNDCDGDTDEGVRTTCYTDADRDGFAPMDATATDTCGCADGTTSVAPDGDDVDCDDASSSRSPSVTEECNAVDDDCDTAVDEGLVTVTRYVDADGDGYAGDPVERCEGDPGSEGTSSDCDESRTDSYVGAPELCDGIDNDCSSGGGTDLGEDMDGDEHAPTGGSCTGGPFPTDDCDDGDDTAYLGAAEICDGADDDCDGDVDERATTDALCDASITPGTGICLGGDCHVASCPPGTEDCNGDLSDGCETDVYASSDHCGRCGSVCLGACVSGRCTVRATQIAAHTGHTCVVLDDGNVACWGNGVWLSGGRELLPTLAGFSDARSIAVGNRFSCAVTTDDEVWCWGNNEDGQVGVTPPSTTEITTPTSLMGSAGLAAMSFAGQRHACSLETDGTARCWGYDRFDQLGDQVDDHMVSGCDSGYDCSPTPVDVLELTGIAEIGLGSNHSCFLLDDGTVECLGIHGPLGDGSGSPRSTPEPVPGVTGVSQLATGTNHNCALMADATVLCWGTNSQGQLGNPAAGSFTSGPISVDGLSGVSSLEMGTTSSAAILSDGTVRAWGDNSRGELGDGTTVDRDTPVVAIDVRDAADLGVGSGQACVLRVDGSVACWGDGGNLGDGTDIDRLYSAPARFLNEPVDLAMSGSSVCGLRSSGDAWCWGLNSWGELGSGEFGDPGPDSVVRLPQRVVDVSDFVALDLGSVSCGIRTDGTLWCWGLNGTQGRLGTGTTGGATNRPQQVPGLSGVIAVSVGHHLCAVHAGGQVSCWGENLFGEVGGGSDPQTSPLMVSGVTDAIDVATARNSTCAVLADGSTDCWGDSIATYANRLTGLRMLAAGDAHYCGIRVDGQVLCVGWNGDGQIGDGTSGSTVTTPHAVAGMTNAIDIAVGRDHSCAVLDDGTVWCWGDNVDGQLGSGTADGLSPQQVPGITDAVAIDASSSTTCIRHQTGRFSCWGRGSNGQLGTGETIDTSPPVRAIWH